MKNFKANLSNYKNLGDKLLILTAPGYEFAYRLICQFVYIYRQKIPSDCCRRRLIRVRALAAVSLWVFCVLVGRGFHFMYECVLKHTIIRHSLYTILWLIEMLVTLLKPFRAVDVFCISDES